MQEVPRPFQRRYGSLKRATAHWGLSEKKLTCIEGVGWSLQDAAPTTLRREGQDSERGATIHQLQP